MQLPLKHQITKWVKYQDAVKPTPAPELMAFEASSSEDLAFEALCSADLGLKSPVDCH